MALNDRDFRSSANQIGQVVAYGHSGIAGSGTSDTTRDVMTRLTAMLGAKEYNYATPGAVLMWTNDLARVEQGVMGMLLQTWKRPVRAASNIATVDPAIGATTITLTATHGSTTSATGTPFKAGDIVSIGTGANAELAQIASIATPVLTLQYFQAATDVGWAGLVNDHALGEPVQVVPTHYGAGNTLFLLGETMNQPQWYSPGVFANAQRWYQEALRTCISRLRSAEVFEPDHTALAFTGSWSASAWTHELSGSSTAQGYKLAQVVNDSVTFHVPANFPGGTVALNWAMIGGSTSGSVFTYTVDAVGAGTTTMVDTPAIPVNKAAYYCKRFTGLAAGPHTIVATLTTLTSAVSVLFDSFHIEAIDPPVVMVVPGYRVWSYDVTPAASYNGHIRPTITNANANAGATAAQVTQAPIAFSRQIVAATPIPRVGEYIVLSPRTAIQEVKQVTSVTGASSPFTINFAAQPLANQHNIGATVEMGIKDYDLRELYNPWVSSVCAEFDDFVTVHDPDPYLNKQKKWFHPDGVHLNDEGAALSAEMIYRQLIDERHLDPRMSSRLSRPVTVPTTRVDFLNTGAAVIFTNMPAAVTEFAGATGGQNYRRVADMSRYYEARLGCWQTVAGLSTAKLRIQYSVDNGTTWKGLHRLTLGGPVTNWIESTAAADVVCQIDVGTGTGLKTSTTALFPGGWGVIYPEATMPQYEVLLRVVGIGGDGIVDPAFLSIWMELR